MLLGGKAWKKVGLDSGMLAGPTVYLTVRCSDGNTDSGGNIDGDGNTDGGGNTDCGGNTDWACSQVMVAR